MKAAESLIAKCLSAAVEAENLPRVSHQGIARQRGYMIPLAEAMRANFGSAMCGTVATIATVALREKITLRMVERALKVAPR